MLKKCSLLALLAATTLAACAPKAPSTQIVAAPEPAAVVAVAEPPVLATDLVDIDTLTSNKYVRSDISGEISVRVRLHARPRKGAKRPPINLALAVDTSGSMEGDAIRDARAASLALLDSLSEGDRLAVVVFHSTTEVLVPSTQLTKKTIGDIREKISAIKARGTTDLAGGLQAALSQVQQGYQSNGINRIVLLGDGVPNDASPLAGLAQSAAQQRVAITSLGLGLDYDETVMSKLALTSGGKYHFINDSAKVAKVFTDEVLRLKEVSGRATVVTLKPGPGVTIKEVIGLPVQPAGGGASSVVLGDLSEGDERDVLVRLSVPARHAGSVVELLDANVSFDHPGSPGQRLTETAFVSVKATSEVAEIEKGRERDVEHTVARLSVADAIVRAVAAARGGNLALARSILDAAEKEGKLAVKEFGDEELAEKVKSIDPVRRSFASLAPPPPVATPVPVPPNGPRPVTPVMGYAPAPAAVDRPMPAVVMKTQAAAMEMITGP